jgi:hypothetical protein
LPANFHSKGAIQLNRNKKIAGTAAILLFVQLLVGLVTQTTASASVKVSTYAGTGTYGSSTDGSPAASSNIATPSGLFVEASGKLDFYEAGTRYIRQVDLSGNLQTIAGNGGYPPYPCTATGPFPATSVSVYGATSLTGNSAGDVFVNYCTWTAKISAGTLDRYAGDNTAGTPSDTDGPKYSVKVRPDAMVYDEQNDALYFVQGQRIKVVNASGQVVTIAGAESCSVYAADGDNLKTTCLHPVGLAYKNDHLYFGDSYGGNRSPEIFRIDLLGGDVKLHKIAGSGSPCWCDGASGSSANSTSISSITDLAVSSHDEVFFGSSQYGYIRKVDTNGLMQDVATLSNGSNFMTFDNNDNLFVSLQNYARIMKVSGLYLPPTLSYVALGDSVVAGEGINYGWHWDGLSWVETNSTPTWETAGNFASGGYARSNCHRSKSSYPSLVANNKNFKLLQVGCTGASAPNGILSAESFGSAGNVAAQLGNSIGTSPYESADYVNAAPDVVTLTVGADDIHFKSVLEGCYGKDNPDCNSTITDATIRSDLISEASGLRDVLQEIVTLGGKTNKIPHVYVTGYYDPFPVSYPGTGCKDIYPSVTFNAGLTSDEMSFLKSKLADLNSNISAVAALFSNVTYVDISNVLLGHQMCNSDPWVYGASIKAP